MLPKLSLLLADVPDALTHMHLTRLESFLLSFVRGVDGNEEGEGENFCSLLSYPSSPALPVYARQERPLKTSQHVNKVWKYTLTSNLAFVLQSYRRTVRLMWITVNLACDSSKKSRAEI